MDLPEGTRVHPVFHVSQLKQHIGNPSTVIPHLPPFSATSDLHIVPQWLIDYRWVRTGWQFINEVLVHWEGLPASDATWEPYDDLKHKFSHLNLEDKVVFRRD